MMDDYMEDWFRRRYNQPTQDEMQQALDRQVPLRQVIEERREVDHMAEIKVPPAQHVPMTLYCVMVEVLEDVTVTKYDDDSYDPDYPGSHMIGVNEKRPVGGKMLLAAFANPIDCENFMNAINRQSAHWDGRLRFTTLDVQPS